MRVCRLMKPCMHIYSMDALDVHVQGSQVTALVNEQPRRKRTTEGEQPQIAHHAIYTCCHQRTVVQGHILSSRRHVCTPQLHIQQHSRVRNNTHPLTHTPRGILSHIHTHTLTRRCEHTHTHTRTCSFIVCGPISPVCEAQFHLPVQVPVGMSLREPVNENAQHRELTCCCVSSLRAKWMRGRSMRLARE